MNSILRKHLVAATFLMFLITLSSPQLFAANRPWIGIYMQDITADLADAFSLSVNKGVLVNDVAENSPAEEAGLKAKDVILAWNGKTVINSQTLTELVGDSKAGDKVKLSINRAGKDMEVAITVGERKEPRVYSKRGSESAPLLKEFPYSANMKGIGIGVSLQSLSGDLGTYFGVPDGKGALITEVMKDTPAQEAGLKAGDVVLKADDTEIETPSDVSSIIGNKHKGDKVKLVIMRDKSEKTVTLAVDEIESLGSADMLNSPEMQMYRYFHDGKQMPQMRRFDSNDNSNMQQQLDELQNKLEEMQQKLQKLEGKMR